MPPYLVKLFERVVETQHTIQEGKLVEAWFEMGRLTREAEAHQRKHNEHILGSTITDPCSTH